MNSLIRVLISISLMLLTCQFVAAQCMSGNCENGTGIYVYPSGAKYVGEFKDGEIHGKGVCYYSDGSKYQGNWDHRYPQGFGIKTFKDETRWEGQWVKGKPVNAQGEVIEIGPKAQEEVMAVQSGCLKGDCKDGSGVLAYPDGSRYEGQFRHGRIEGWGTWYYPNGDRYIGNFKNNLPNGKGNMLRAERPELAGYWLEGEYVGAAEINSGNLGCINGDCTNGEGTYIFPESGARYTGGFKNGLPNGKGICYYADGKRYIGLWKNGYYDGEGTLYAENSERVSGFWDKGTYTGDQSNTSKPTIASQQSVSKPEDMKIYAVIVGVANYNHMPSLRYTDDDAYKVYAFFKSPKGGALPDDQISILIDEDATKLNILNNLRSTFSKADENDLVILYFSGHGLQGSFLPIDFDGYTNVLKHSEISQILDQTNAKYKLCIADACHSGSFSGDGMEDDSETIAGLYTTLAEDNGALLLSSKGNETSLESTGLRQGVFSHFLIRGLKGEADANNDQVVTIDELFAFIAENVKAYTANKQNPILRGHYDANMPVSVLR